MTLAPDLRIGSLTLVHEQPTEDARHRRWLCECTCGRRFVRGADDLLRAARNRVDASCRACSRKRFRLAYNRIWYGGETAKRALLEWEDRRSVWPLVDEYRLEREIRRALDRAGFRRRREPMRLHEANVDPAWWGDPEPEHDAHLADIGREFGFTRERARQIEVAAMRKIRERFTLELEPRPIVGAPAPESRRT